MASPGTDRVAPPLIYAFRKEHNERGASAGDLAPGRANEGSRAPSRRAGRIPVRESELRELVRSDLLALLNTTNLGSAEDLSDAPEVRSSVLNFGFRDLASRPFDDSALADIEREIGVTLRRFEPRLAPDSLQVRRDKEASTELRVRYVIAAQLRVEPMNVPVEFVAEVEVDSGKVRLDRL